MTTLNKELMIRAYNGISFSPEKRGETQFTYYSELLKEDLEKLGENKGNYEDKFCTKIMDYFSKLSRCMSTMITGPANFPVRKNQQANNSADKAYEHFWHWREKYFKAVNRERTLSPEEEIDKAVKEVDTYFTTKENMKSINKLIKKSKVTDTININDESLDDNVKAIIKEIIEEYGISEKNTQELFTNDSWYGLGFPKFEINSLTTKIRERKKKIEIMKVRIERKSTFEDMNFEGGRITINNDRVVVEHDEKPSKEVIKAIKESGFRYSPKTQTWVRKHTGNAIYSAQQLYNNVLNK